MLAFLAGRAEALFAGQANLLRQPVDLLLQDGEPGLGGLQQIVFRSGNGDGFHACSAIFSLDFLLSLYRKLT